MSLSTTHPKHDIHKFQDIIPKLGRDNLVSWKGELLATARDRGLYGTITGTDTLPSTSSPGIALVGGIYQIGTTPLTELVHEWNDRNNVSHSQILLTITPEFQTAIDRSDVAAEAWGILIREFKSYGPRKISIIRMKYENVHMVEGQLYHM